MFLNSPRRKLFITGKPGVGKTTLIEYLYKFLKKNLPSFFYSGFITKEIKEKGKRTGFKIILLNSKNKEFLLAKVKNLLSKKSVKNYPFIGKYAVFVENLNNVLELLKKERHRKEKTIFVIDEIGKMECLSSQFCNFVENILNSETYLIATLGKGDFPFLKKVRKYTPAFFCNVTLQNRDFLKDRLTFEFVRKGKLIVIEGIDGAGKTTLAKALYEALKNKGIKILISHEPTDSYFGKKLKLLLTSQKTSPKEICEYFLKDRFWHVQNVIIPALKDGYFILLDRYYLSTLAYQGAYGLDLNSLLIENETISPLPDLVIYLDVSLDVAFQRIKNRKKEISIFENSLFLQKVSEIYKYFLNYFNHIVIDGNLSVEENVIKILEILKL